MVRLPVAVLVVRRLSGGGRGGVSGMHRRVMRSAGVGIDRQSAMHGARVQLGRLRQTNDEPDRERTGQNSRQHVTTHTSNIEGTECSIHYRTGKDLFGAAAA